MVLLDQSIQKTLLWWAKLSMFSLCPHPLLFCISAAASMVYFLHCASCVPATLSWNMLVLLLLSRRVVWSNPSPAIWAFPKCLLSSKAFLRHHPNSPPLSIMLFYFALWYLPSYIFNSLSWFVYSLQNPKNQGQLLALSRQYTFAGRLHGWSSDSPTWLEGSQVGLCPGFEEFFLRPETFFHHGDL